MSDVLLQTMLIPETAKRNVEKMKSEHGHNYADMANAILLLHPGAANVREELPIALAGKFAYHSGNEWMMGPSPLTPSENQHDMDVMMSYMKNVSVQLEQINAQLAAMKIDTSHDQSEQLDTRLTIIDDRMAVIETNTSVERWTERWTDALPLVSNVVIAHIKPFIVKLLTNPLSTIVVDRMDQPLSAVVP